MNELFLTHAAGIWYYPGICSVTTHFSYLPSHVTSVYPTCWQQKQICKTTRLTSWCQTQKCKMDVWIFVCPIWKSLIWMSVMGCDCWRVKLQPVNPSLGHVCPRFVSTNWFPCLCLSHFTSVLPLLCSTVISLLHLNLFFFSRQIKVKRVTSTSCSRSCSLWDIHGLTGRRKNIWT